MTKIYRRFDRCVNCGSFTTHVAIEGTSLSETYKIPSLFCSEKCRDEFYKLDREEQLLKLRTDREKEEFEREKEEFKATKAENNESKNTCAICDKEVTNDDYVLNTTIGQFKCCSSACLQKLDYLWDKSLESFHTRPKTSKNECEVCGKDILGLTYKYVTPFKVYKCCSNRCLDNFISKHNSKDTKDTSTKKDTTKWTAKSHEQDIPLKCMTCGKNMFFNKHVTVIKTKNGKFIGMFCNEKCADNYYSKVQVKTHEVIRAERLKRDWHPDN